MPKKNTTWQHTTGGYPPPASASSKYQGFGSDGKSFSAPPSNPDLSTKINSFIGTARQGLKGIIADPLATGAVATPPPGRAELQSRTGGEWNMVSNVPTAAVVGEAEEGQAESTYAKQLTAPGGVSTALRADVLSSLR